MKEWVYRIVHVVGHGNFGGSVTEMKYLQVSKDIGWVVCKNRQMN